MLKKKKLYVFVTGMVIVVNSTLGSAIPSGAVDVIATDFGIINAQKLALRITAYLVGYILGPILFGHLSETYGRRPIMLWTFAGYTIFTLACAVAPNFTSIVVFRLFAGIFASSPTAVVGGLYADIFSDPKTRGRAMAGFMAVTMSRKMTRQAFMLTCDRLQPWVPRWDHSYLATSLPSVGGGHFGSP